MREQETLRIVTRSVLIVVLTGIVLWFSWTVRSVLVLFLISAILATGLLPIVDALSGRQPPRRFLRLPRAAAVLVIYLVLIAGAALIMLGIIPPLVGQVEDLIREVPQYIEWTSETLAALVATYPFLQGIDQRFADQVGGAFGNVGAFAAQTSQVLRFALNVVNGLLSFLLLLVMTFYLIVDGGTIHRGVLMLLPAESRPLAKVVTERVREKIGGWLLGQILLSTIIGTATFVGLLVLGVPYALLLAVVAAIGELIPMLGPVLAAIPAVIVASFVSPLLGLLTLGLCIVIQQLENNIIVPLVMRRAVDLPPVVVMVALLMGAEVLGVVGAILALPIAAALSVTVGELIALRDGRVAVPEMAAATPDTVGHAPEPSS